MKRKASGSLPKGERRGKKTRTRKGFSSVARTRGAQVTGEMKIFDTEKVGSSIPSVAAWTGTEFDPATFDTLCVPQVGSAINQRDGKSIQVHKIKINGTVQVNAQADQTAGDNPSVVRVALVLDTQTNAVQAQGEEVFKPTTNAANAPFTFQNENNFGRFRVLKDMFFKNDAYPITYDGTNVEQGGVSKLFKIKKTFKKPITVRFNAANGGTVADIVDNSFHIYANSSNALSLLAYNCRVNYKG